MFPTSTDPRPSAADGLRDYGLAGIELGHRRQQRHHAAARDLLIHPPSRIASVRQWLGVGMVRLGASIAGEAATGQARPALRAETGTSQAIG